MVVLIKPQQSATYSNFTFTYQVSGTRYDWFETVLMGPNGKLYFWVAIGCAAFIGLMFFIAIIYCIVKCCRKGKDGSKVYNAP